MIFNKLIKKDIAPFLKSEDFNLVGESKDYLKFKHKDLVIVFMYNYNPPFEIEMNFQFNNDSNNYNFASLKDYFGYKIRTLYAGQIKEDSSIVKWTGDVNNFLSLHLDDILTRINVISKELSFIRNERIVQQHNLKKEAYVSELINKAWKKKDYMSIVQTIEEYKINLKGSTKKKYEYALMKLS